VLRVPLARIHPCPFQPRKDFPAESLQELADSIREQGIVQPLIVRAQPNGFELIAGERRWRAAQLAGLTEVPVLVREADDRKVLELALIENLQRENLNPIEEALGYAQLIEQFQLRQEDAATRVGRSRAVVTNALRLLRLPSEVQAYVRDGLISVGHAKVILGLPTPDEQKLAATKVIQASLNVRQAEELVTSWLGRTQPAGERRPASLAHVRDVHVTAIESRLQERFGTRVSLRYREGKGALEIKFFNDEDLNRILQIAGVSLD
jgi:ParB family chromosome partitioning protein